MVHKNKKRISKLFENFSSKLNYKYIYGTVAAGFMLATLAPILLLDTVSAYGQIQSRSIEMSNSAVSATGVTYNVNFYPATNASLGGIVVDFCSNDPIIGDSCTAPAGFSVGSSPSVTIVSGIGTGGSWGATTNGVAPYSTLFETNATPQAVTGTGTLVNFTINNVTNPSTLGSFYARIITYDTQAHANSYTATALGSGVTDAGGVALSTVQQITITSKVQEVITFCVYTSAFDSGACSGTGSTVTLGNNNGVLSTQGAFVDINTKYDIQSNALHGVNIRFTGTVPTSGSNVIEASANSGMGANAATAYTSNGGNPQFGLCTWAAGGTTANLTPSAPYDGGGLGTCSTLSQSAGTSSYSTPGAVTFGFDTPAASGTYGDILASSVAGPYAEGEIGFVGNISNTTVAGIYTTTLTFIATGTY
jgi:hypothetical protein